MSSCKQLLLDAYMDSSSSSSDTKAPPPTPPQAEQEQTFVARLHQSQQTIQLLQQEASSVKNSSKDFSLLMAKLADENQKLKNKLKLVAVAVSAVAVVAVVVAVVIVLAVVVVVVVVVAKLHPPTNDNIFIHKPQFQLNNPQA